jgi:hypothetical protein
MTSFVHTDVPTNHRGVARVEAALAAAHHIGTLFRGAKGLVALLLAGAFSALVVVADQVVNSWADGQVVIAWIVLWTVLFLALALFTEASKGWASTIVRALEHWSEAQARRLEDERTWRFALSDPRFMSELQIARCRAEEKALESGEAAPEWPFSHMPTQADTQRFTA